MLFKGLSAGMRFSYQQTVNYKCNTKMLSLLLLGK